MNSVEFELVRELEARIITGKIKVGEFLPPERTLSNEMELSRPVIHNALIRLEEKGFIQIIPRRGARVLDYKVHGYLNVINSLIECHGSELNHHFRNSILNLLKGHCDLLVADITGNEYDAVLELPKETLFEAMNANSKPQKIDAFMELYTHFGQSAVNPFYSMFINSCHAALRDIAQSLVDRDSAYHTFLRLWTSLLHQLKAKNAEKAYAINQTLFELLFDVWK